MVIQLLICLPGGAIDQEVIKDILLQGGRSVRRLTSQACDVQYREMDIPQDVLAILLRQSESS